MHPSHVILVREGFVVGAGSTANIEPTWCLPAESDHRQQPHNHKLDSHSTLSAKQFSLALGSQNHGAWRATGFCGSCVIEHPLLEFETS